jgi:hypothetical protein
MKDSMVFGIDLKIKRSKVFESGKIGSEDSCIGKSEKNVRENGLAGSVFIVLRLIVNVSFSDWCALNDKIVNFEVVCRIVCIFGSDTGIALRIFLRFLTRLRPIGVTVW